MDTKVALIPLVGMAIPMVLVPVVLHLKHARYVRQLEHAERMKALEMGRTLPMDEPWWSPSRLAVAFGVALPIGVFFCAWMAASDDPRQGPGVWLAATLVALAGVVSGAVIGVRHTPHDSAGRYDRDSLAAKPTFDADTFDVVGSRG